MGPALHVAFCAQRARVHHFLLHQITPAYASIIAAPFYPLQCYSHGFTAFLRCLTDLRGLLLLVLMVYGIEHVDLAWVWERKTSQSSCSSKFSLTFELVSRVARGAAVPCEGQIDKIPRAPGA